LLNSRRRLIFFVIMLLLPVIVVPSLVVSAQADAAAAIASAKEQIVTCYQAARDAEGAGANITSLTVVLNDAGSLLSRAELAYSMNDFDGALNLAVQSRTSLDNFVSESNALKETAVQQRNLDFWVNIVGSIVGTFAVLGGAFAVWVFLRRRYSTMGVRGSESSRV
jgi:hypothetical protein